MGGRASGCASQGQLDALPADTRASFERIVRLIQMHGLERVREPYVRHLEGPLWEMRLRGRDGIARAVYVTAAGRRIVVVRVFAKKTQKTPRREIRLALNEQRRSPDGQIDSGGRGLRRMA